MSDLIPIRSLHKHMPMSDTNKDIEWVKSYDVQTVAPEKWAEAIEENCELILAAGVIKEEASSDEWIKSDVFTRAQP